MQAHTILIIMAYGILWNQKGGVSATITLILAWLFSEIILGVRV
jgi:hypothetical protein